MRKKCVHPAIPGQAMTADDMAVNLLRGGKNLLERMGDIHALQFNKYDKGIAFSFVAAIKQPVTTRLARGKYIHLINIKTYGVFIF